MKKNILTLLAGLLVAGPLVGQITFTDDFNRAGTGSQTSASDPNAIGPYTIVSGSWEIPASGGGANTLQTGNSGNGIMYYNGLQTSNAAGFSISVDAATFNSYGANLNLVGLVFNFQDNQNYYQVRYRTTSAASSTAFFQLIRVFDGTATTLETLSTANSNIPLSTYHTLSVETDSVLANTFNYSISSVGGSVILSGSVTDSSITSGYAGFYYADNSGVKRFDNFTVTAVPEPATYAALFGLLASALVFLRRRRS